MWFDEEQVKLSLGKQIRNVPLPIAYKTAPISPGNAVGLSLGKGTLDELLSGM